MVAFLIMTYKLSVIAVAVGFILLLIRMGLNKPFMGKLKKVEQIRKAKCLRSIRIFGWIRMILFATVPLLNTYMAFALTYILCVNDDIFNTYIEVVLESYMKGFGIREYDLV